MHVNGSPVMDEILFNGFDVIDGDGTAHYFPFEKPEEKTPAIT
jgi:hypothetical protein